MRRWEMGDPMMVAMRRQEASCDGCKFKEEVWGKEICNNPKLATVELRRCRHYQLKGVANG
jgi:hypothetical protein